MELKICFTGKIAEIRSGGRIENHLNEVDTSWLCVDNVNKTISKIQNIDELRSNTYAIRPYIE